MQIIKPNSLVINKLEKVSGLYLIVSSVDNKRYVGQSTELYKRIRKHYSALIHNRHTNSHLQSAWNLYGESNFCFYVLELCDEQSLDEKERYYISKYNSMFPACGYNRDSGGNYLKSFSDDSRKKMSESHKGIPSGRLGKKNTPEQIEKSRQAHLGKVLSEETRKKISLANMGRHVLGHPQSNETRNKIRLSSLGRKNSEESKMLLSVSLTGRKFSDSHRENISKSHKGKSPSKITKEKLSKSIRGLKRKVCSSNYIGVCWKSREKKWHSRISFSWGQKSIGWFDSEIDAAKAYDLIALEYFGLLAKLNFPKEEK